MPTGYRVKIDTVLVNETQTVEKDNYLWRAEYEHTFRGIAPCLDAPDVVDELDMPPGTAAFLVLVTWSTGDSFGRDHNSNCEAFGIFPSFPEANAAKEWLQEVRTIDGSSFFEVTPQEFVGASGQRIQVGCVPWDGYFDNLEIVEVIRVEIPPRISRRSLEYLRLKD